MATTALGRGLEVLRASGKIEYADVARLGKFLMEGEEEDLFRMNPIRYAHQNGMTERDAIELFLYAAHAGLLELTWGLLCPACRAFLSTTAALRGFGKNGACRLCCVEVQPGDDSIEVAFTVSPSVRRLRFHDPLSLDFSQDWARVYFSPSNRISDSLLAKSRRAVLWSQSLGNQESCETKLTLRPGGYGLVAPLQHVWTWIHVEEGAGTTELEFDLLSGESVPTEAKVEPGEVTLRIRNRSGEATPVGIIIAVPKEEVVQGRTFQPFLSGKRLITSQAFRELFRAQSIPASAGLEFKRMAVLFTDLKGSTQLYEQIGDVRAYALVREHFDLLREIIDRAGGAMVKTIGDAIMASFSDVEPAMAAAAAMRADIARVGEGQLQLKVGVHAGPCIAVELNEQLDYFGQTVNVAARVQGLADGGEIVCTEDVWRAPGVAERAHVAGLREVRDRALLKGVDGEVTVYRLRAA